MQSPVISGLRDAVCALLVLTAFASTAIAQTQTNAGVPGRGAGSFSVTAEHVTVSEGDIGFFRGHVGEVTYRALYLEFDYGLTDRLALTASLPTLSSNRYVGDDPHRTDWLIDDHGEELLDDGNYHTYWTDMGLSLRWAWRSTERFALTPFVGYYAPIRDYPLYGFSQPAPGQWRLDAGLNASGRIGAARRNMYWKAGFAYSYMDETRPTDAAARRVNRSRMTFELGWRITPRVSPYFLLLQTWAYNGYDITDFNPQGIFVSDEWYYHDQLAPWEQTYWAVGAGYQISDELGLSFGYGRTSKVEVGFFREPAVTFGVTYGFARRQR